MVHFFEGIFEALIVTLVIMFSAQGGRLLEVSLNQEGRTQGVWYLGTIVLLSVTPVEHVEPGRKLVSGQKESRSARLVHAEK